MRFYKPEKLDLSKIPENLANKVIAFFMETLKEKYVNSSNDDFEQDVIEKFDEIVDEPLSKIDIKNFTFKKCDSELLNLIAENVHYFLRNASYYLQKDLEPYTQFSEPTKNYYMCHDLNDIEIISGSDLEYDNQDSGIHHVHYSCLGNIVFSGDNHIENIFDSCQEAERFIIDKLYDNYDACGEHFYITDDAKDMRDWFIEQFDNLDDCYEAISILKRFDNELTKHQSIGELYNSLSEEHFTSVVKNYEFTPHTLHLRPSNDDSSTDEFIQIKSIQDVLSNARCNCELKFLGIEEDSFSKLDEYHFEILNSDTNEELFHFSLLSNDSLSESQDKLEPSTTILAGTLDYKVGAEYFTDAVNNEYDEILKTSECIDCEKSLIENQLSNYTKDELDECLEALENSINNLSYKGLELFTSQNQKNKFIHHCFSKLFKELNISSNDPDYQNFCNKNKLYFPDIKNTNVKNHYKGKSL